MGRLPFTAPSLDFTASDSWEPYLDSGDLMPLAAGVGAQAVGMVGTCVAQLAIKLQRIADSLYVFNASV